jgi:hypothetical protein
MKRTLEKQNRLEMYLNERRCGVADWTRLVQARAQWRTVINTTMDVQVPRYMGHFDDLNDCYLSFISGGKGSWHVLNHCTRFGFELLRNTREAYC